MMKNTVVLSLSAVLLLCGNGTIFLNMFILMLSL